MIRAGARAAKRRVAAALSGPATAARNAVAVVVALVLCASPVAAQVPFSGKARAPDAAEEIAFRGVGRVTIAGRGFCTGSLIASRLVLTAAHCLYDSRSLRPVPLAILRFVPGSAGGLRPEALRIVRAAAVPSFSFDGRPRPEAVASDLALLELAEPVDALPLQARGRIPGDGEKLLAIAYGFGRIGMPGVHEECGIRGRFLRVLVLDCRLELGGSGAPVLAGKGSARRIVGIVSASGRDPDGAEVTFAVEPGPRLPALRAALAATTTETPAGRR